MPYELKDTERIFPVMIYTPNHFYWGKLVHPMGIRPQNWLKMAMVPEFFLLMDANMLIFGGQQPVRLSYTEIYIPVSQILAFHLVPPFDFEPDFDPDERNREMKPVSIISDIYRFDGKVRVSSIAEFAFSIQGGGQSYFSLYDVTASHPTTPGLKPMKVPYALIRSGTLTYLLNS